MLCQNCQNLLPRSAIDSSRTFFSLSNADVPDAGRREGVISAIWMEVAEMLCGTKLKGRLKITSIEKHDKKVAAAQ